MLGHLHLPPVMTPLQDRSSQLWVYLWESLLCLHCASPPLPQLQLAVQVQMRLFFCYPVLTIIPIKNTQIHKQATVCCGHQVWYICIYKHVVIPFVVQIQLKKSAESIWMQWTLRRMLCECVICYNEDNTQRRKREKFGYYLLVNINYGDGK